VAVGLKHYTEESGVVDQIRVLPYAYGMDPTTLMEFFLASVTAALILNAVVIWFAYKAFNKMTMKVTGRIRELETKRETKDWLESLRMASEQAVHATETTKRALAELESDIARAHDRYGFLLAEIDLKIDRLTTTVSRSATRVRDASNKSAEKFATYAADVQNVLGALYTDSDQ
jgi:hypothetical protein